jgi:hypothetical protein
VPGAIVSGPTARRLPPPTNTQVVPNQAPIEAAVSELIKRNQHLQNALTIKTDTKAQLEGQIRDLAITVALHAKANKELYRNLSRARDQIWRLRFQHEALDWINHHEPILPTRKRTSSTEGSSQLSSRGTVTAAEPMRKRRLLDTHKTGNHIAESTPPPKSMDAPGKFYESTGDARTLAKPTSPDRCQNKTTEESDPVPCGNATIRRGRSSSIDELAFSYCENQALKPNNATHRSKQTGRPPNTP